MKCKICGISDSKTLIHLTNHSYPPQYIGFIVNYPKSKRFVPYEKLKQILNIDKKKSKYVAVLVKPNENILEEIKNLPFDYYQIYDTTPSEINLIKQKYRKKIIVSLTINGKEDVMKYLDYYDMADIILFDSKGYEKSMSFDHQLIQNIKINKELMLAGNIQVEDNLEKYKKIQIL